MSTLRIQERLVCDACGYATFDLTVHTVGDDCPACGGPPKIWKFSEKPPMGNTD